MINLVTIDLLQILITDQNIIDEVKPFFFRCMLNQINQ